MGPGVHTYIHTYETLWNFADVTLADDDTNSILADDANRAIWGWWLSSNRWWSSPMWAWRSTRWSARWWYMSCTKYWSWCAVIMLATIYVVGTLGGNGCHWDGGGQVGWHGSAQGGKGGYQGVVECLVLNWNLHPFRILEIIQVLDSISWVRCASGNVSLI